MSSDSDEDIGLRLQKMTNKYHGDKIESTALLNDSNEIDEIFQNNDRKERESSPLDLDELPGPSASKTPDELPEIGPNNPPKRVTRSSARKRNANTNETVELPLSAPKRTKNSTSAAENTEDAGGSTDNSNTTVSGRGRGRGKGRGRGRGKKTQSNAEPSTVSTSNITNNVASTDTLPSTVASNPLPNNMPGPAPELNTSSRGRGRKSRGRSNRRNRGRWGWFPTSPPRGRNSLFAMMQALAAAVPSHDGHTYVIGDAEDVADKSRGQALFSNQKKTEEVVDVEENENYDPLDDNEELSVKVHWQSYKYEIFKIRRYQKLTQIFDYFAQKENVGYDKLLFMYNDKIIKPTDTPDSINYNIAKKIEGGTLENSVAPITDNEENFKDGIKLKFQCQHLKKPFEIAVRPDDKFSVAMTKCAEHLEKPLSMLRFEFDGDVITGKSTARDLELEGGECIDVKVAS